MATGAAAAIAAAVARAQRDIREHFENAGAFDPQSAVSYDPPDHMHERQFELMIGRGVLRPEGRGRYWIDRDAERLEEERRRSARTLMLKIVLVAVALAIAAAAILSANA
jgi:hypothetical protein